MNKCEFHVQETKFIGIIISTKGIGMDPEKVSTILHWAQPTTLGSQVFFYLSHFVRKIVASSQWTRFPNYSTRFLLT